MSQREIAAPLSLAALEARARAEMNILDFATKPWVAPVTENGEVLRDVVIVGAGQSGLAAGFELRRRGVTNVLLVDANPEGYEGVWETYARNYEIRSPKDITGLEGGLATLSIEAYVRAAQGAETWENMVRVPRRTWMAYLRWFRSMTGLEVMNDTRVTDIAFDARGVTLALAGRAPLRARQVVLATGMEGGGRWQTPAIIAENLPRETWNHSADIFDAAALRDKRVAVIGAGAAAFDMAVTALDAGARSVDMLLRRAALPMRDVIRELENGGYLVHAHRIPDAVKWNIANYMSVLSQAPAEHHFHKACACENFNISLGSPIAGLRWTGAEIELTTPRRIWQFDHLFAATGVSVNMAFRPELGRILAAAALWRDRFTPPRGEEESARLDFPYLDANYRFTEREPGTAPGLDRIFAFNAMSSLSVGGLSSVSIGAFRFGTRRLADAVTERLFEEQIDGLVPYLDQFDKPGVGIPANMAAKLESEARALAALSDA